MPTVPTPTSPLSFIKTYTQSFSSLSQRLSETTMKPPLQPAVIFSLLLLISTAAAAAPATPIEVSPTPSPTTAPSLTPPLRPPASPSSNSLDPKQLIALQSLNIPTFKDPCKQPSLHNATVCDSSEPFRHIVFLRLANCSDDVALSFTALKSLSTLRSLEFVDCPISPIRFPADLVSSLRSFTCTNSLRRLTGVWLSRLENLTDLSVTNVPVNASGPFVILGNMNILKSVTISNANLTGFFPKHLNRNLTHIDFSGNMLKGKLPTSITLLENLESLNLGSNAFNGEIPTSVGDLISLQNLSLASNSLSGSIPESISAIPGLVHLDLSSNQFNGTIPKFLSEMKSLKYLNLENNQFEGVFPFNGSFLKKLEVFKIKGNSNLCYNHSILSSKLKLGIAPCDRHGLPLSPPPAKDDSSADDNSDYNDSDGDNSSSHHKESNNGPNKVVLGVAIGLSSIIFLIVFLVCTSKCCR